MIPGRVYQSDGTTPIEGATVWTGSKTTGQPFNETIVGRSEGTKYYFRAQAKNSTGSCQRRCSPDTEMGMRSPTLAWATQITESAAP